MRGTEAQTVSAYNEKIEQMKVNHKEGEHEIFCSLLTFNGNVYEHLWREATSKLTPATIESFEAAGGTALRDAVGYGISKLLEFTPTEDHAFLVDIISDGEENSSQKFNTSALRELIESCQAKKNWTFTYLGCSEAYLQQIARETAIPAANMAAWSNRTRSAAKHCLCAANKGISGYYSMRSAGGMSADNVYNMCVGASADFASVSADSVQEDEPTVIVASDPNAKDVFQYGGQVKWKTTSK